MEEEKNMIRCRQLITEVRHLFVFVWEHCWFGDVVFDSASIESGSSRLMRGGPSYALLVSLSA